MSVFLIICLVLLTVGCDGGDKHTVDYLEPKILSVSPQSVPPGGRIVIGGECFASSGKVLLNNMEFPSALILSWTDTRIEAYVPPDAVSGTLYVLRDSLISNGVTLNIIGTQKSVKSYEPYGTLKGKTVVVSPGHGYYYNSTLGYWTTQRPDCFGLIEDIHTNEIVIDYLIPSLERMGARVLSCRERSYQENEIVVDNDAGVCYEETGVWNDGAYTGYNGGAYRWVEVSDTETATAIWRPYIPEDGYYPVYVWYREGGNRAKDALYRIHHAADVTEIEVDQTEDGMRWHYLGSFYFYAGDEGYVELSNRSSESGKVVVADAVRFGAGYGSIERGSPPTTSGQPRWKECSRYWLQYLGAPDWVYDDPSYGDGTDDVGARKRYANWAGADLFISLHTNAGGGTGTETYIHDSNPYPGSYSLRYAVHSQIINDIRILWDADWYDRGEKSANFGELRDNNRPAILIELAFHDKEYPDNYYLHQQEFRLISARAIAKGVAKFIDDTAPIAPLPPINLTAEHLGDGYVVLKWRAQPDPTEPSAIPTEYVVYRSEDGYAWDNGFITSETEIVVGGFSSGEHFFRVEARNAGGLSLPSDTASCLIP